MPLAVHTRNAINETLDILQKNLVNNFGVIHCFNLNEDFIKKFLEIGFYFGFGGIITFTNAVNVKKSILNVPLNKILLETDAPYLTPCPFRGKINHSKYLLYIAREIANIKNKSFLKLLMKKIKIL